MTALLTADWDPCGKNGYFRHVSLSVLYPLKLKFTTKIWPWLLCLMYYAHPIQYLFYRKVEVYEMKWQNDVNLENSVVIPARFGGPIAVIRDRTKPDRTALKGINKPVIALYSSSGQLISSFVVK